MNKSTFRFEGKYVNLYENGLMFSSSHYKDGKLVGLFEKWNEEGVKIYYGIFCNGFNDSTDCNCIEIDGCLGEDSQLEFANSWHSNGKMEFSFIKAGVNEYRYIHFKDDGQVLNVIKLKKMEIGSCYIREEERPVSIYFLGVDE